MSRKLTIGILVTIGVLLIIWDIYVYVLPGDGDTISEVILAWAKSYTIVPFSLGVLAGHLLWPQKDKTVKVIPTRDKL